MNETRVVWHQEVISEEVPADTELGDCASSVAGEAGESQPNPTESVASPATQVQVSSNPLKRGRPVLQERPAYLKFKAPKEHYEYLTDLAARENTTFSDVARVAIKLFVIAHRTNAMPVTTVGKLNMKHEPASQPNAPDGLLAAVMKRMT